MRTCSLGLLALAVLCATAPAGEHDAKRRRRRNVVAPALQLPLAFVENEGQFAPKVRYQTRVPGLSVNVLRDGWSLHDGRGELAMRVRFEDASREASVTGADPLRATASYFSGDDADAWIRGASMYGRVRIEGIRPGLDVDFFERDGLLEYDLSFAPGTSTGEAVMVLEGVERTSVRHDGSLVCIVDGRRIHQRPPRSWQTHPDGRREELDSAFIPMGGHRYGFFVAGRDPELPLTIDPILIYSQFVGGSSADEATSVAVDQEGAVYVTGWAKSSDFPLAGAPRRGKEGVVFKLDPSGGELVYATYFGGENDDEGRAIAVTPSGEAVIVGQTKSDDFPTTVAALSELKGRGSDAFVLRLSADGSALVYASFLGGEGDDQADDVTLGPDGSLIVVGTTRSDRFPASPHAIQSKRRGGRDVFVSRLDADGRILLYSTFLGGVRDDYGRAVVVDENGNAYVTGRTESADFPTTRKGLDRTKDDADVFVSKLGTGGGTLIYSTFLGGSSQEEASGIAIDRKHQAYVVGWTQSFDFPTTMDALQKENRARRDGFVIRLSESGGTLGYGSYLGGSGHDEAQSVTIDSFGTPWIVGHTSSRDLPVTYDAVQHVHGGGRDAFLVGLDPRSGVQTFGTFLGGRGDETALDVGNQPGSQNLVLAGFADDIAPEQQGTYSGKRGTSDALVARFEPGLCGNPAEIAVVGTGCGVSIEATPPRLGRPFELQISAPASTRGHVFLSGTSTMSHTLEGICEIHVDRKTAKSIASFVTDADGKYTFRTILPKDMGLCGQTLVLQVATFDEDVGPLSFGQLSEGLLLTPGD